MLAEKALDLIRELQRSTDGTLPPFNDCKPLESPNVALLPTPEQFRAAIHSMYSPDFNTSEDKVKQVLEEMRALFDQNQKDVSATVAGETGLFSGVQLRHAALERNKRCLLAYLYNRIQKIRNMRWEFGSVLPQDVKYNLSEQEVQWFNKYNKCLANYMRSIGGTGGLDLTQDMKPPKTLYIEVRCLVDHGEFETQDGNIIVLKKNSQHFLLRSECEHLIRQGILEHMVH